MPGASIKSIEKIRIGVFFLTFIFIFAVLFTLSRLTIPLGIAYLLYLIFSQTIPLLIKLGLNRISAISLVLGVLIFLSIYPLVNYFPIVIEEANNVQQYVPKVERFITSSYHNIKEITKEKTGFELEEKWIQPLIEYGRKGSTQFILNIPKLVGSIVEWIFLVPLFTFFMLKDGRKLKFLFLKLAPNSLFERFYYMFHQFNKQIGDYIFAKFVEASIVGAIITTGLLIIDVRFSVTLGLVAGLTNVIPYLGPVLGIIPAIIVGLLEYGVGPTFIAMLVLYLVANAIDMGLVFPILISKIVDLHPVMVIVSVILGSQYLGVIGMVISIPVAATLKLVFLEIYNEVYGANR
jgi:putative permease